jgi:Glycosyl hydrolases family 2, sugar binding domain/Glycosyl hydrolases family 2/Glycosyl hydrolases family 2, TIM barrel domain
MKKSLSIIISVCFLTLILNQANGQDWKPVPGNIMTTWATTVTPENVWKEYPRPQMVRKEWKNLNGLWDFAVVLGTNNVPSQRYNRKILVPFCVESALSGIKEAVTGSQEMLYRRSFSIPDSWKGKRIILHFEAVDYISKIWVDGKSVGDHKGGYEAFQFDITDVLNSADTHELSLVVWDPSNTGTQPIGKQTLIGLSKGNYTPTSGIWQTVWMEPVSDVSIRSLKILPDVDLETLTVDAAMNGWSYNNQIKVQAMDNGAEVASGEGVAGKPVTLKLKNPKLWSPESPYLYDLKVSLLQGGKTVDEVESYFGMRKISIGRDAAGLMRINLNNKMIFQLGPLDQGYWPDGILTPASDEALKFDVEYLKKIGCNMDRVHMKVQPERFYYYCDKLGLLIWQDMIAPGGSVSRSEVGGAKAFETEWESIIDQLYSHPSIIQWTVFNESWGQYDTERLTDWTKKKDPSRLVSNASGWVDRNVGDIRDYHDYTVYPSVAWVPKYYPRAMVLGEGGGHELTVKDHMWSPDLVIPEKIDRAGDLVREITGSPAVLDERYNLWVDNISIMRKYGMNAVVYTQISDVENELNGWLTYDRKVSKIPVERLAAIHSKFFKPEADNGKFILPLSMNVPQKWMYSFVEPGSDWFKQGSKGTWNSGNGPFGKAQLNVPPVNTKWETGTLYLQRDYNLSAIPSKLAIVDYNNGISDVYINGELAIQINNLRRWDPEVKVSEVNLPEKAMKLLKKGTNHIAVKFEFGTVTQFSRVSLPVQPTNYFDLGLISY